MIGFSCFQDDPMPFLWRQRNGKKESGRSEEILAIPATRFAAKRKLVRFRRTQTVRFVSRSARGESRQNFFKATDSRLIKKHPTSGAMN
jgi:hypothetical protein